MEAREIGAPNQNDFIFYLVAEGNVSDLKNFDKEVYNLLEDRDIFGHTYLHRAIYLCTNKILYEKQKDMINYLISEAPQLIIKKNDSGETALSLACSNLLYSKVIKTIIQSNPQLISTATCNGTPPLMQLSYFILHTKENEECIADIEESIKLLISHGADINAEDICGISVLQSIVSIQNDNNTIHSQSHFDSLKRRLIQLLLKNGANICSKSGVNALINIKTLEEACILLKHDKSQINVLQSNRWTVLHHWIVSKQRNKNAIIKKLLENGAEIETGVDIIYLARINFCDFIIIQMLLEKHPGYNINSLDNKGKTLLMAYGRNYNIVNYLLLRGADASLRCYVGDTALLAASRGKDIQAIRKLIECGANPLHFSKPEYNIATAVLTKCTVKSQLDEQWFQLLYEIINLPQMKDDLMHCKIQDIYYSMFSSLFEYENWNYYFKNVITKILTCMVQALPNFNSLLMEIMLPVFDITNVNFDNVIFEPFGFAITKFLGIFSFEYDLNAFGELENFVNILFNAGLQVTNIPNNCITALSSLIVASKAETEMEKEIELKVCNLLIDKGVDINSRKLQFTHHEIVELVIFNNINFCINTYKLPDALLISILCKNKEIAMLLLSYWAPPPLLLMTTCPVLLHDNIEFWLPILVNYGGIPHGTDMFTLFLKHMRLLRYQNKNKSEEFQSAWNKCLKFINTPLSLQELCKYSVRQYLADIVVYPTNTLPSLIQELPPLLRVVVMH